MASQKAPDLESSVSSQTSHREIAEMECEGDLEKVQRCAEDRAQTPTSANET